jgi:hypothetical protein
MENLATLSAVASMLSALILLLILVRLRSMSRVESATSGASISAKELGAELASSIDAAFKAHVPNPEKFAAANSAAIDQAIKQASDSIATLHKNFLSAQTQAVDKWSANERAAVQSLENAAKAIETAASRLNDMLTAHIQQLDKSQTAAREQLKLVFTHHIEGMNKAASAIAGQLDKIMQLEKDIQQVLHIQQVVDGSIKAVSTAEEFKTTLVALRKHLEQSDALIREATKPRTIRLIEQEA